MVADTVLPRAVSAFISQKPTMLENHSNGFISLHRKILDNPIWQDIKLAHLFVTLLLLANHEDKKMLWNGRMVTVRRGELITGRDSLAKATGIHPSSIYREQQILADLGMIAVKSNNKFSLISIVKYSDYQLSGRKSNNQRTTNEQQLNTNKSSKSYKSYNKYINKGTQKLDAMKAKFLTDHSI